MKRTIAVVLHSHFTAMQNCQRDDINNTEWAERHDAFIGQVMRDYAPRGSGFDCGTHLDFDKSNSRRLVFTTEFHHMEELGNYDGWTQHTVTVTPTFDGLYIRVSGRSRNDIKSYIRETFDIFLSMEVEQVTVTKNGESIQRYNQVEK